MPIKKKYKMCMICDTLYMCDKVLKLKNLSSNMLASVN